MSLLSPVRVALGRLLLCDARFTYRARKRILKLRIDGDRTPSDACQISLLDLTVKHGHEDSSLTVNSFVRAARAWQPRQRPW